MKSVSEKVMERFIEKEVKAPQLPHQTFGDTLTAVLYRCTTRGCGAEDYVRISINEVPPKVINCWKCKAGQRLLDLQMQAQKRIGMVPVIGPADHERGES